MIPADRKVHSGKYLTAAYETPESGNTQTVFMRVKSAKQPHTFFFPLLLQLNDETTIQELEN